jgi:hypothetical protein
MAENIGTGRQAAIALVTIVLLALVPARYASASFFDLDGEVLTCNPLACSAAGINIGDPVTGTLEADDAVSGPNSTFTEADIPFVELTVGTLTTSGSGADLGTATLSTDGDGEIVAGTISVQTEVDTGLGIAIVDITVDAASETWQAETTFLGLGVISSGTLSFSRRAGIDTDGDGVIDSEDNCIEIANADQRDTNGDFFGNACDPDLDNDGIVNTIDLGIFKNAFFGVGPDEDFNGDGVVNPIDLGVMKAFFFQPPGPSGTAGR